MIHDLRFALRQFLRRPGFTLIAILTLALGIGATTAIFSVIHSALRLPFPHSGRIIAIKNTYPGESWLSVSWPDFQLWQQKNSSFSALAAVFPSRMNYIGPRQVDRISATYASADFTRLFGLTPLAGRDFLAAERQKGASPVCLLSRSFAIQEFGSPAATVGHSVVLDGKSYSVVGVLPEMTPSIRRKAQVWLPLEAAPPWDQHGTNYLFAAGLLKPGVSIQQAQSDIALLQAQIDKQFPANKHGVQLVGLSEALFGDLRPIMLVLLGAVSFILLIACVNLANMLLARSTERMREFGIRQALGAGQWRILRQSFTENALLAFLGGTAGLSLALCITHIPVHAWPKNLEAPGEIHLSPTILLFTASLTIVTCLLFGLIPAIQLLRNSAKSTSPQDARTMSETREMRWMRSALVVAEIAFATLLVGGALQMSFYFFSLLHTDTGMRTDHLLSLSYSLPESRYPQNSDQMHFYQALQQKLTALPGVESVSATASQPFSGSMQNNDYLYEGGPAPDPSHPMFADVFFITDGYLNTMQAALLRGRFFSAHDTAQSPRVAVLNQSMVTRLWPGQNPIGKHIQISSKDWQEVVGVVADIRNQGPAQKVGMQVYLNAAQYTGNMSDLSVMIRTQNDPLLLADAARQAVHSLDPALPVSNVTPVQAMKAQAMAGESTSATLMSALGVLALLLASVGVYGVMAYSVNRRLHEFGIRLALGAQPRQIFLQLLTSTGKVTLAGTAIGLLLLLPMNHWLRASLSKLPALQVSTLLLAVLLLAAVAFLATLAPARRAARTSPMQVIRTE